MSVSFFQYVITHTQRNIYFVYRLCVVLKVYSFFWIFKSQSSVIKTQLYFFSNPWWFEQEWSPNADIFACLVPSYWTV